MTECVIQQALKVSNKKYGLKLVKLPWPDLNQSSREVCWNSKFQQMDFPVSGQMVTISWRRRVEMMCGGIVTGGLSPALHWSRSAYTLPFDAASWRERRIDSSPESCLQVYQPCSMAEGHPLRMWVVLDHSYWQHGHIEFTIFSWVVRKSIKTCPRNER